LLRNLEARWEMYGTPLSYCSGGGYSIDRRRFKLKKGIGKKNEKGAISNAGCRTKGAALGFGRDEFHDEKGSQMQHGEENVHEFLSRRRTKK